MTSTPSAILRSLSPSMIGRAIRTFDRLTLLIIGVCWATTITVMIFALYTIQLSVHAKRDAEAALAAEPALPTVLHNNAGGKELQVMIDRLQKRYPDIGVSWQNGILTLVGANGSRYHQWMIAIGQVDTLYPQFHWKIRNLCIGTLCGDNNLMNIELIGERISFEIQQTGEKK